MNEPDPHEFPVEPQHDEWHDGGTHPLDPPPMPDESTGFVPEVAFPDAPTTDPTHAAPAVHREGADPTSADQPEDAGTAGTFDEGGEG